MDHYDSLFFKDEDQKFLQKIPWLSMKSDQYFIPYLFLKQSFKKDVGDMFPDIEFVFHFLVRVVEFYPLKSITIGGYPSKLVDFIIEDSKNNRIKCTVWDSHVDDVLPYFTDNVDGPIIILMQLCRAKHLDTKVRISSSYNATKVWINHDCPEFEVFKDSLNDQQTPIRSMTNVSTFSYPNSQEYSSKRPMIVSTIADIYRRAEPGYYHVPARINGLESARKWYYSSCKKEGCFRKLEQKKALLWCDTCKISWQLGIPRYRLGVRVGDKSGDAPFLLWDNECSELLGLSAYDLRNKYLEV
ncbi:PREDICTED: uncharacterized protein LOC109163596 [Ipomoea nil]|uniref:uncharacterized protein LOC109163596 n=1 Tax=Ipomoea nil TaxID=35883 RepID=UPI000901A0B2|nr:PREDICTED: uncharacterized protein LOC109163596 [Ipomoea nil]